MKRRNKTKRLYRVPVAYPMEVALEAGLLADSVRFLLQVDELDNINAHEGVEESGDMYFEF